MIQSQLITYIQIIVNYINIYDIQRCVNCIYKLKETLV